MDGEGVSFTTSEKLQQYIAYLQDLASMGSRQETARGFYLSVLSGLLAFRALAGDSGPLKGIGQPLGIILGIGAIAVCCLWLIHTLAFMALYKAKFANLSEMEAQLPFQLYGPEFSLLKVDWRYTRLSYVECAVALVFVVLFLMTMLIA